VCRVASSTRHVVTESLGVELEMPFVIELEEGGGVGVLLLQVEVVHLGLLGRVPTVLTNIDLRSALLVLVLVRHSVHFQAVALEGASLGEGLFTEIALVRPNSCMCPGVPLQIECIIESLSTECAEVTLGVTMTLHVSVEETSKAKCFSTDATCES